MQMTITVDLTPEKLRQMAAILEGMMGTPAPVEPEAPAIKAGPGRPRKSKPEPVVEPEPWVAEAKPSDIEDVEEETPEPEPAQVEPPAPIQSATSDIKWSDVQERAKSFILANSRDDLLKVLTTFGVKNAQQMEQHPEKWGAFMEALA